LRTGTKKLKTGTENPEMLLRGTKSLFIAEKKINGSPTLGLQTLITTSGQ